MYYVLDDYVDGIIYAGADLADLEANLPAIFKNKLSGIDELEYQEYIYHGKNGYDFYLMRKSLEDLIKYMGDRNALNFLKGV